MAPVTRFSWLLMLPLLLGGPVAAAEPLPAPESWVPQDALVVLQITRPQALLDLALDPQMIQTVTASPAYARAASQKNFRQLRNMIQFLEGRFDTDWKTLLRKFTGGGITLALGPDDRALLIVDAEDAGTLEELHELLLFFARGRAENEGRPERVTSVEYRGVTGWTFAKNEAHAIVGRRLLVANQPELLRAAIDLRSDPAGASLARLESYQAACQALGPDAVGHLFVRFDVFKQLPGFARRLRQEGNPLGALLLAPMTQTLLEANWLALGLRCKGTTLRREAVTDAGMPEPTGPAAFASASDPGEGALPNLDVPGRIAAVSFYRDLHGFYAAKDELFPERTSGLIFFENMMGIFFTGRDLTEEVLAETDPHVRFVVAQQEYDPEVGVPAVQIPAFAAVFRMRHPEKFAPIMEEAWQKAIGLVNFTRGQQAQPGLIIDRPAHAGTKYTVASFAPSETEDRSAADVRFNFSPALAMPGEYLILSSTAGLARDLMDAVKNQTAEPLAGTHSLVEVDGSRLASILEANRENLIRQNMVEEGNTREEAETQITLLLTILDQFAGARLEAGTEGGKARAELAVHWNQP